MEAIAILGAAGRTGTQLAALAETAGHRVIRLGRRDSADPATLAAALGDAEIAVSTVGQGLEQTGAREAVIKRLLEAAPKSRVQRIVAIASSGVLERPDGRLQGEVGLPDEYRLAFEDHRNVYRALAASAADWILLCPPFIPDGDPTGTALWAVERLPENGGDSVTAGELARLTLVLALDRSLSRKRIGVAG